MESSSLLVLIGTPAAVVTTTVALVAILKRAIGTVPVLERVPVWVYAVLVASGLTWLSAALGYTTGALPDLIVNAIIQAAAASGFRDWMTEGDFTAGIGDTRPAMAKRIRDGSGPWA